MISYEVHLFCPRWNLRKECKNRPIFDVMELHIGKILAQATSVCKKVTCPYLMTPANSIGAVTISIWCSDSGVSCTDSTTGRTALGVLAKTLQRCVGTVLCGFLLLKGLFPPVESVQLTEMLPERLWECWYLMKWMGNFTLPEGRVHTWFFHIEVVCGGAFRTQGSAV